MTKINANIPLAPLGEVCEIISGQSPPSKDYNREEKGLPFYQGKADFGERYPVPRVWCDKPLKTAIPNDILFCVRAPVGPTNIAREECCIGRGLAAVRPGKDIDRNYLLHFFRFVEPKFAKFSNGSTFKAITRSDLSTFDIPLPPLTSQRRIAAILDKADALRRKRAEALRLTDEFLQSVFLDMFGDPVTNPKGWETTKIGKLLETQYGTSKKAGTKGEFPILRMNNITCSGGWKFDELKYIDLEESEIERFTVHSGDILFNRTNSPDLVGKTAVYREPEPMAYAGYLVRGRVNDQANPEYISAFMNSAYGKQLLRSMCKSIIGMANINATEFRGISILKPPKALQDDFASVVHAVTRHREKLLHSESQQNDLFSSLAQDAFQGELQP